MTTSPHIKKLIMILVILVLIAGIFLYKANQEGDESKKITVDDAITLVKAQNPELNDYPSDNLPPKRIETEATKDGWLIGFYVHGSGLPGILMAKCYRVSNLGNIEKTGEFAARGMGGPETLDLSSCSVMPIS